MDQDRATSDTHDDSPPGEAVSEGLETSPVHRRLESARRELLDLTARNRLLNTPRRRTRSSSIEILDELSDPTFDRLVSDGKIMSFLPRPEPDDAAPPSESPAPDDETTETAPAAADSEPDVLFDEAMFQPEDDDDRERNKEGLAERHTDNRLQTGMTSAALQQRLLRTYCAARTYEEEQGVNILYLALGFLKWFESESSDKVRHAPLVLVPVRLERVSATSRFRIEWTGEDITTNLSLQAKLKTEFGIDLPQAPGEGEMSPTEYFAMVVEAVKHQPRWEVLPNDMVLWFFSFAKLLMYRDLDPENWPAEAPLDEHSLIASLLGDGFDAAEELLGEDEDIDSMIDPSTTLHVMDADSSQAMVIEEVRRGRNLVIQGPPGTGKSQTITNIIAAAVAADRRVLFVAEKAAALNVVKRRLDAIGLGDMCLALHSNKTRKRDVLDDLKRTLELERPVVGGVEQCVSRLREARDKLTGHATRLHEPLQPARLTPYRILGDLVRLQSDGIGPAPFELTDAPTWTHASFDELTSAVSELARTIQTIGVPSEHPWRGVMCDPMLPMDVERLLVGLAPVIQKLQQVSEAADALAQQVQTEADARLTFAGVSQLVEYACLLAEAPDFDRAAITDPVWIHQRHDVAKLCHAGSEYSAARSALNDVVEDVAWSTDVIEARRDIAAHGRSLLRIFSGAYRRAQATLRGIVNGPPPRSVHDRVAILDQLIAGQRAKDLIGTADPLGRRAFGTFWRGADSDWTALGACEAWESRGAASAEAADSFRQTIGAIDSLTELAAAAEQLRSDADAALRECVPIFEVLQLDVAEAFGDQPDASLQPADIDVRSLIARFELWQSNPESIHDWIRYRLRATRLSERGLGDVVTRLYDNRLAPEQAVDSFHMAYYEALFRHAIEQRPELAAFQGAAHEQVLAEFQELDAKRIELARAEVALAHHQGIPRGAREIGELGVIRREINKKRRHLPLRRLFNETGSALTRIKPVFMMSPLSVAQYLEPGKLTFDLLLIDEASQVQPVDALGAAARVQQIVVVGDDKQLPPTRFFASMVDADNFDEETDDQHAGDMESILGLCCGQNMAQRMLRWHYRSRHHSLIAVSNHEFYDNRLFVIPSPSERGGELGVFYHRIEEAIFDRGGSATNKVEAERVAQAVMEHARQRPDATLGVGAFSVRQRDAIIDQLERLRRQHSELEHFFAVDGPEPFFIKNLENVQGDERDVIFISVGYGPDKDGFVSMNFGPLSNEGGERRLNVLITRARERCEVFSSMGADDIDLTRVSRHGPRAFKTYLQYAKSGELDVPMPSGRDFGSGFEASVARVLRQHGVQLDTQVGVAGFFIDLAVKDPDRPGRYVLGIECDGASYHSSRSARDRDRIRQQVLEDRGWVIHRIWSTDWFNQPQDQLRKVLGAIERARAATDDKSSVADRPSGVAPIQRKTIQEHRVSSDDSRHTHGPTIAEPYTEASFEVPGAPDPHELPVKTMAGIVARIVQLEHPIHRELVIDRARKLFGLSRAGSRFSEAVRTAIEFTIYRSEIADHEGFLSHSSTPTTPVRDREDVQLSTLRTASMLPPSEIRRCLELLVARHLGVTRDEAITSSARVLGFKLTSAQLRTVIDEQITILVDANRIQERETRLYPEVRPETTSTGDPTAKPR